jgi:hypothetical protein
VTGDLAADAQARLEAERIADAEALVGLAALALSTDLRTYQALLLGLPVPCRCLEPRVLKAIGMTPADPWLVLTLEQALLIEASRPKGGYGFEERRRR